MVCYDSTQCDGSPNCSGEKVLVLSHSCTPYQHNMKHSLPSCIQTIQHGETVVCEGSEEVIFTLWLGEVRKGHTVSLLAQGRIMMLLLTSSCPTSSWKPQPHLQACCPTTSPAHCTCFFCQLRPLLLVLFPVNIKNRFSVFSSSWFLNVVFLTTPVTSQKHQDISSSQRFFYGTIAVTSKHSWSMFLKKIRILLWTLFMVLFQWMCLHTVFSFAAESWCGCLQNPFKLLW